MNYETHAHESRTEIASFYEDCAEHALVVDAAHGYPFEPCRFTRPVPDAIVDAGVREHHATVDRVHGVADLLQAGQRVALESLAGAPAVAISYEEFGPAHLRLFTVPATLQPNECWAIRQGLAEELGEPLGSVQASLGPAALGGD